MYDSCRICLSETNEADCISVYLKMTDDKSVLDIIKECSSIEIAEDDHLPKFVCPECIEKLDSLYKFRNLIIKSDLHLKEKLDIKTELFDDPPDCTIEDDDVSTDDVSEENVPIERCRSREVFVKDCKEDLLPEVKFDLLQPQEVQADEKETDVKDSELKEAFSNAKSIEFELQDSEVTSLRALRIVEELSEGRRFKVKKESYECEICHKTYKTASVLKKHVMIHTGIKPFSCEFCGKGFLANWCLNIHRRVHTGDRPHSCEECGKKFGSPSGLIIHKRTHGSVEKRIQCEVCDLRFYSSCQMKYHMRRHAGKKPFMCEICSQTLSDKATLIRHRDRHLEKEAQFPCPVCGKAFRSQLNLRVHAKTHSGLRPYACDECGKTFTARPSLNRHKMLHTGVKPYKCKVCEKSFSQGNILVRHMRIHSGEKPYPCPACPREFSYKHHLQGHVRSHHRDATDGGAMGNTVGGS